jgi:hypothetical protein
LLLWGGGGGGPLQECMWVVINKKVPGAFNGGNLF